MSLILLFPLFAGILMFIFPKRMFFLVLSLVGILMMSVLCFAWYGQGGELVEMRPWIVEYGIDYSLNMGGLGIMLIASIYLLLPFMAFKDNETLGSKGSALFFFIFAFVGSILATDLILLYIFFVLSWIVLVIFWRKDFEPGLFSGIIIADVIFLAAILYGGIRAQSFSVANWVSHGFTTRESLLILWGMLIPAMVRIPFFPLHRGMMKSVDRLASLDLWLVNSAFPVMALVLCYRSVMIFKAAAVLISLPVVIWAIISAFYYILLMKECDSWRKISFFVISFQSLFAMIGIFSLQEEAMLGSLLLISSLVINSALLLLFADGFSNRSLFFVAIFSVLGLPPFAGFFWNFFILLGAFQAKVIIGSLLLLAVWLFVIFLLKIYARVDLSESGDPRRKLAYLLIIPFSLALFFGVFPKNWISMVERERDVFFEKRIVGGN